MSLLSKQGRREQAVFEVVSLLRELDYWVQGWNETEQNEDGSRRGQYKTQVNAVYSEVHGAASILKSSIDNLNLEADAGSVYEDCANAERQVLWVRRVWYFFRDKFDQRNDERFSNLLRAADEVIWSCYRPFFQLSSNEVSVPEPAPLPYIDPDFSPSALRRDQRQALANKQADFTLVADAFAELPVPILKIPTTTINNPWALVLVGHEVGHIIGPLISSDFPARFREEIRSAVEEKGGTEEDQEAWFGWSDEIFADLYSVITMGQWAVWALTQFETAREKTMSERRLVYPSPIVRLEVMVELAKKYGLSVGSATIPSQPSEEMTRDLNCISTVVDRIVTLPEISHLVQKLPFEKSRYEPNNTTGAPGEVGQWSRNLLGEGASPRSNQLRSARMIAAACAQAWSEKAFVDASVRQALGEATVAKIRASFAPGVRSSAARSKGKHEPGRALFDSIVRNYEELSQRYEVSLQH